MGYDCANYLGKGTKLKDVQEFLILLGFEKINNNFFFFFERKSLVQLTGIDVSIYIDKTKRIVVYSHTTVSKGFYEHEVHNNTLRQLKKRFGGYFTTSNGKNRYLTFGGPLRKNEEAACFKAYFEFDNNKRVTLYQFISLLNDSEEKFSKWYKNKKILPVIRLTHPPIIASNIGIPYLLSTLEEYLRVTYIALFSFSGFKKEILKKSKIQNEDLYSIANESSSVEEIISKNKSFQNIDAIDNNFKEIDRKICFKDLLKRTTPKSKYLEKLQNLIFTRHALIHQAQLNYYYSVEDYERDVKIVTEIIKIFYDNLIKIYKWHSREY